MIERQILPLPVNQRGRTSRYAQVQHAANDNGMGMALDNVLNFTIESNQGPSQERYARNKIDPFSPSKSFSAAQPTCSGKALGNIPMLNAQDVDTKHAMLLEQRP